MHAKLFTQHESTSPLSLTRCLLLIINYYLGFIYIYPRLAVKITLWLNPWAYRTSSWVLFGFYVWMILFSIVVAWPLLKESIIRSKPIKTMLWNTVILCFIVYVVNIAFSMLASSLSGTVNSVNQEGLNDSMNTLPALTFFVTLIYAPIVEEVLFRGVFFRCLRHRLNLFNAVLVSGIMFGLIHVLSSLSAGNLLDSWYLLTYAGIGFVLAIAYEMNQSIYPCILIHFMINFLGSLAMFL